MQEVLSLRQAILATLTYFDILDFPLTISELADYLYGWQAPEEAIEAALRDLNGVSHAHGYYYLKGREEISELRKERKPILDQLWNRVEKLRPLLALCPYVKMVAIVNSVALGNVKETSDIDLFVVTENGKLHIARLFMKVFTQAFGLRVHHEKIAGRFCLSFFVAENALNLKPLAHDFDPHLAYFVKTAMPIFGASTYKKFIQANSPWVSHYFKRPLTPREERLKEPIFAKIARISLENLSFPFSRLLEMVSCKWQGKRDLLRKKKLPSSHGVVMSSEVFKFHENDPRKEIAEIFKARLGIL